jgi:hypothetical protein
MPDEFGKIVPVSAVAGTAPFGGEIEPRTSPWDVTPTQSGTSNSEDAGYLIPLVTFLDATDGLAEAIAGPTSKPNCHQ